MTSNILYYAKLELGYGKDLYEALVSGQQQFEPSSDVVSEALTGEGLQSNIVKTPKRYQLRSFSIKKEGYKETTGQGPFTLNPADLSQSQTIALSSGVQEFRISKGDHEPVELEGEAAKIVIDQHYGYSNTIYKKTLSFRTTNAGHDLPVSVGDTGSNIQ
ncbi:hypothetical protein H4219_006004 [Mycoemilia scoparia]|uniref:Uncharacterized protein n=1 Tax=Mycoemilia scoparia TaxID=417184 RepID=A0A9W8DJX2_9FUNG|nr:hypothetical protein H4219_006004 [Mycoemilia scoparia]